MNPSSITPSTGWLTGSDIFFPSPGRGLQQVQFLRPRYIIGVVGQMVEPAVVSLEDLLPAPVEVRDRPLGLFPRLVKVKDHIARQVLSQKGASGPPFNGIWN